MLQVVASPTIVILTTLYAPMIIILTTLEVSFMLSENIYSTASLTIVTYDLQYIFFVQATGLMFVGKARSLP
jgi:hypothetical protein